MKKIIFYTLFFLLNSFAFCQTVTLKLDSLICSSNDSTDIVLHVANMNNVGAITINITIDTNRIQWGRVLFWDSQLEGALAGKVNNSLVFAWDGLSGANIPNGVLAVFRVFYINDSTKLVFNSALTEIADIEGNVIETNLLDGLIVPTSLVPVDNNMPNSYCLFQNYPNPFNPNTKIKFSLPNEEFVTLEVFDVLGNKVSTLINEITKAGTYEVSFSGEGLATGVYFSRLQVGNFSQARKMLLVK